MLLLVGLALGLIIVTCTIACACCRLRAAEGRPRRCRPSSWSGAASITMTGAASTATRKDSSIPFANRRTSRGSDGIRWCTSGWRRHCLAETEDRRLEGYNIKMLLVNILGRHRANKILVSGTAALLPSLYLFTRLLARVELAKGKEYYSNTRLARTKGQVRAATKHNRAANRAKPCSKSVRRGSREVLPSSAIFFHCVFYEPACLAIQASNPTHDLLVGMSACRHVGIPRPY